MNKFLELRLLQGMVNIRVIRNLFMYNPIYCHSIFKNCCAVPEVFDPQDCLHKARSPFLA